MVLPTHSWRKIHSFLKSVSVLFFGIGGFSRNNYIILQIVPPSFPFPLHLLLARFNRLFLPLLFVNSNQTESCFLSPFFGTSYPLLAKIPSLPSYPHTCLSKTRPVLSGSLIFPIFFLKKSTAQKPPQKGQPRDPPYLVNRTERAWITQGSL